VGILLWSAFCGWFWSVQSIYFRGQALQQRIYVVYGDIILCRYHLRVYGQCELGCSRAPQRKNEGNGKSKTWYVELPMRGRSKNS
jgi:hypothetical protein